MTLEQRLSETLHEVDRFDPSPDLFARVSSSLEEDAAHRRRVLHGWLASLASFAVVVVYLGLFVSRDSSGSLVVPHWAIELLQSILLIAIVILLAPLIRRFGGLYVADVFRLDAVTGSRFLRLLDTAYYLVFAGAILMGVTMVGLEYPVRLGRGLEQTFGRIAVVLGLMGVFHAVNLLVMPLIGLVFSSTVRRAARARAGAAAPPLSDAAARVDRIITRIVWALATTVAIAAVLAIGIVFGIGVARDL